METPYYLAKSKQLLQEVGCKYKGASLFDDQDNAVNFNLITNSDNKIWEALGTQINKT